MLGRHVRVHLSRQNSSRILLIRSFDGSGHLSRRSISFATFTEPISRAVASLPYAIQHDIPQSILHFGSASFPEGWPVYSIGFFAFAIATRLLVFTPWAYWARKRKWKSKEVIEPRLIAEFKYGWGPELRGKLRRKGLTSREWLMAINDNMSVRQKELAKQFDCGSLKTTLLPLAFTAPAFILSTSIALSASSLPEIASNPSLNEFCLALPTQDHFPLLPVGLGVFALLTTDIGTWSPKSLKQMSSVESPVAEESVDNASSNAPPKTVEVKPHIIALTLSRAWSLARVVVAIGLPGTVQIVWFTSAFMSFLEARIFSWIESKRRATWGGNSPLVNMKIGQLRKLGVEISPEIPLERLGEVDYGTATLGYFPRPRHVGPLERTRDTIANLRLRLQSMSPGPSSSAQPASHVRDGFVRLNDRENVPKKKIEEVKAAPETTKKSKKT